MTGNNHNKQVIVGLGIDVGGTFSDSVLIDLHAGDVLSKAKSPTTHDDLVKGIEQSVGLLDRNLFPHIRLVSLSTTLATNAIVEGRRSRIAVILAGYKPSLCPDEFMQDIHLVNGGHTVEGDEMVPLDVEEVRHVIESTRESVDAYAISSYFATRNPAHELEIQKIIHELAPSIPITCGHELSQKLNAKNRATTTILNAHLIPLIHDLVQSVKSALREFSINAPLMVVKGDGSLLSEKICLNRPVETILSGPAASVVGGGFLMGHLKEDAVVMDIGGTTSDIAVLQGGHPKLNINGVTGGPWQTHVTAVDVRTIGLGGDSHIRINSIGTILIGPKRVEPLCLLAKNFPDMLSRLESIISKRFSDPRYTPSAFWFRTTKKEPEHLSDKEKKILKTLSQGPLNIFETADALDTYPITLWDDLIRLDNQALIRMSGFTPTDIFHIRNLYNLGIRECSVMAAQFLARQMDMDMDTLLLKIDEIFNRKAGLEIIESLSSRPVSYVHYDTTCPACHQIWRNCFWEREESERQGRIGLFRMQASLDAPLVVIGAPAHILAPPLAKRMEAKEFIPEHAEVANALGAIVGTILISEQVLIRPSSRRGFVCFSSSGKNTYGKIEEAIGHARRYLADYLQAEVRNSGGNESEVNIWEERKEARLISGEKIFIEIIVHGEGVAKPRFQ